MIYHDLRFRDRPKLLEMAFELVCSQHERRRAVRSCVPDETLHASCSNVKGQFGWWAQDEKEGSPSVVSGASPPTNTFLLRG